MIVKCEGPILFPWGANLISSGLNIAAEDAMSDKSSSSRLVKQVSEICSNKLQYAIEPQDISSVFVLPVKKSQTPLQAPSSVAKRMVVVKFVQSSVRDDIYAARIKLATFNRSTSIKIYINEDLPSAKLLLFAELRKLANTKIILNVWLQNNKIFVKAKDGSFKKNVLNISDIGLSLYGNY